MQNGNAVSCGEDAELFGHAREGFERLLRLVAIADVTGVVMEAGERNRCHGISCGSRRVLQRFAAGCKHAQALAVGSRLAVEEASRGWVEKARDHCVGDVAGELEVAQVSSCLVRVKAGE